jgi:hypothetical protein
MGCEWKAALNVNWDSLSAGQSDNGWRPLSALPTGIRLVDTAISSNPPSALQPAAAPVSDKAAKPSTAGAVAAPATAAPSATVTLSPAAQAAQEASETPEQTAREARGNDRQAQQLVAKQAAVAKMYAGA